MLTDQPVDRGAVVLARCNVEIESFVLRKAAPTQGRADQVSRGIDLVFVPNMHFVSGQSRRARAARRAPSSGLPDPNWPLRTGRDSFLAHFDCILPGVGRFHVLPVGGIDQSAQPASTYTCADLLLRKGVAARAVDDSLGVVVLIGG